MLGEWDVKKLPKLTTHGFFIIQRTRRLFNQLNMLPQRAGNRDSISIVFCWRKILFVEFEFVHKPIEELHIRHFPKLKEKCAKWSRIAHISNSWITNCLKQNAVWRWQFSPSSSSFLLLHSPLKKPRSDLFIYLIITPNFFLSFFNFPQYFCLWLFLKKF